MDLSDMNLSNGAQTSYILKPQGRRGISHGDVIDLNRENIDTFDVREFYVELVSDLKRRGFLENARCFV